MVPIARLGKYMLVDQIGRGAMGEVFRAHDPDLDRYVALKVIVAGDPDARMRFRREAQSAAKLVHPNIVVVHDFGEESGRFFMAMELLDGNNLKQLIRRGRFRISARGFMSWSRSATPCPSRTPRTSFIAI